MDTQTLIAGAIGLGALGYLALRVWRKFRGRTGCGCSSCPVGRVPAQGSKPGGTG